MTSDKRPTVSELTTAQLVAGGFVRSGVWPHDETNGSIRVDGENRLPSEPGVYAYAVGGVVRYVGSAQRGLRRRLRHYGEWPITRVANGRILSGRIDLLVEQPQCLAVYDHKSFPGGHDRWPAEVAAHAPQLATYAEALRAASGLPIARRRPTFPLRGQCFSSGTY